MTRINTDYYSTENLRYPLKHFIISSSTSWCLAVEDVDGEDERAHYQCQANFHWLAKCMHGSQLRRKIWMEVQTTPVAAGGAALPAKMAASAHDVVVDDFERSRWSTGLMVRRSA